MLSSRLNKFISVLLTVNMIGGCIGIEAAASTTEDDSDLVIVSVDLSDHLVQNGAIPGEDEDEELRRIKPRYVSGNYESYRAFIKHRRFSKNASDPAQEDEGGREAEEAKEKESENTPAEEQAQPAEPEKTEPAVAEPEETEPEVTEPEKKEEEAAEPEPASDPEIPEETEETAEPAEEEPAEEEIAEATVEKYDATFSVSSIAKLLDFAVTNWNGTDREISVDVSGMGVTEDNVSKAVSYFINTHGEHFFLGLKYNYSYNSKTGEVKKIFLNTDSGYTLNDIKTFKAKVNEIMAQVDDTWTDLEKALFLHDYIVTHTDYDTDTSNYHYDAYNCLVKGSCVCQGYSLAYDYLCRLAGVSCYFISSSKLNHAWNLIKIGDEEYYIDSTWDDPFNNSTKLPYYKAYCSHRYFLLSKTAMTNLGHNSSDWVVDSNKSAGSRCSDTKYDKYFWSTSISRFAPVSGHKWAYILQNSKEVMTYDFAKNSAAKLADLPTSFTYASLASMKGEVFASTNNTVYKIDSGKNVSKLYIYSGSTGSIYGIEVVGTKLIYYIYSNVSKFVKQGTVALAANWEQKGGDWYYVNTDGSYSTGMTIIGGSTYLFSDTGVMLTGWQTVNGKKHYFRGSGEMVTGWELIGNKYYCFNSKGEMRTGFITSGSSTYYCAENGVMLTGWQQIGKYWYYFSSNKGKMATGWKTISKKQYFFSDKGIMRTGFRNIGGKTYYFTSKGVMKTGWFKKSGEYYYANSKGVVYMKKWKKSSGKWYYLGSNGIMVKSCTKKISGKKYKFNSKGICTNKK